MKELIKVLFPFLLIFGMEGCRSPKDRIELWINYPGMPQISKGLYSDAQSLIADNVERYGNCFASVWGINDIAVWTYQTTDDKSYLRISYLIYREPLKSYVVEVENPTEWLSMADQNQIYESEWKGDYYVSLDGPSATFMNRTDYMDFLPESSTLYDVELDPNWSLDSISYPFIKYTIIDERKYVFNPDICPFKSFRKYYNAVMDSVAARRMHLENKQKRDKGS